MNYSRKKLKSNGRFGTLFLTAAVGLALLATPVAGAGVVVASPSTVTNAAQTQSEASAAVGDPLTKEKELVFRASFGLGDGADAHATGVGNGSLDLFGVNLTNAELAAVLESLRIEEFIDRVQDRAAQYDSFAGLFLDHTQGGVMVVLFDQAADDKYDELLTTLPADLQDRLQVRTVDYSAKDLEAVLDDVIRTRDDLFAADATIELAFWDVTLNRIVLIGPGLMTENASATLSSRYGDQVIVRDTPIVSQPEVCSSREDCTPFQAGIRINNTTLGSSGSGGFIVRNFASTNYYWLTAGHFSPGGAVGHSFSHFIYSAGTSVGNAYVNNSSADALITDIPDAQKSNKRYANNAVTGVASSTVGASACLTGWKTGNSCGTISAVGVMVTYPDGITLLNQVLASYASQSGDSGGGVYRIVSGTNYAVGGHSGRVCCSPNAAVFSRIANITSALGVSLNTLP